MVETTPVSFNGRFLSASPTGVHRVAEQLVQAVDRLLRDDHPLRARYDVEIICPRDATRDLSTTAIRRRTGGRFTRQPWEQFALPGLSKGRLLVSLCNLAPLAIRGGITMIHDAQVFITPASYSRAFRTWYRAAYPVIGRRSGRILTVSEFSRGQLDRFGVAPKEKIVAIHNGVDHVLQVEADKHPLKRFNLRPHRYVLALANTQRHKNIGILLKAFHRPELAELRLVLIGSADRSAFEVAGHAAPGNVVFAGQVTDAEMRGLLENALCLACPSTTEGFGLPPLEAMILGTPAMVAPCGALPEVCGEAALYVDPHDAEAWSTTLLGLAEEPMKRTDLGAAARAHAAAFTWDRAARQLLSVIDQVQAEGLSVVRP